MEIDISMKHSRQFLLHNTVMNYVVGVVVVGPSGYRAMLSWARGRLRFIHLVATVPITPVLRKGTLPK
jgi:hypothetical protein